MRSGAVWTVLPSSECLQRSGCAALLYLISLKKHTYHDYAWRSLVPLAASLFITLCQTQTNPVSHRSCWLLYVK